MQTNYTYEWTSCEKIDAFLNLEGCSELPEHPQTPYTFEQTPFVPLHDEPCHSETTPTFAKNPPKRRKQPWTTEET